MIAAAWLLHADLGALLHELIDATVILNALQALKIAPATEMEKRSFARTSTIFNGDTCRRPRSICAR